MTARYTMTTHDITNTPADELLPKTEAFPDWEPASHTCCSYCGYTGLAPEQGFFCSDECLKDYMA
jgi:hypothetical protein